MSFLLSLNQAWQRTNSLLCVGLDPEPARFPAHLAGHKDAFFEFCRAIIDATAPYVCAFKPQIAYFAAHRAEEALEQLIEYIHTHHPGLLVILDAKRGDIGSTAQCYACEAFERYRADALTVNPYMGLDSIEPYLEYEDKGVILLCRTSNPGGSDLQNLTIQTTINGSPAEQPLYQYVAHLASQKWNQKEQIGLVVGATFPKEIAAVRQIVGEMPLLIPGIGAQGGDLSATVQAGRNAAGTGMLINTSRAVLYASAKEDFAQAAAHTARNMQLAINTELLQITPTDENNKVRA